MEAVKFLERLNAFRDKLGQSLERLNAFRDKLEQPGVITEQTGRRFVRILIDGESRYFVDRRTGDIYGAKSSFQYNERRWFGTLETIDGFTWTARGAVGVSGTVAGDAWLKRETDIQANYKPRGRPRKIVPVQPA